MSTSPGSAGTTSAASAAAAAAADKDAVYFERGRTGLDATGHARLVGVVAMLRAKPELRVVLHGYVDATGDAKLNAALAKRRAEAVRDALLAADVPPDRIVLQAPANIVGGDSPALARRVDVVLAGAR